MIRATRRAPGALACAPALPAVLAAAALFLGLLLTLAWGRASAAELQIEAPRFSFDQDTQTYTYEDGRLTLGQLSVFASYMELHTGTGRLLARGQVRIDSPDVSGNADSLEMDVNTRVGTLFGANLLVVRSGLYLRADEVVFHPDGRLDIRRCDLTSCLPDTPVPWSIAATSMTLEPDGLGVAWNPRLFLGPVPLLWLPGIAWPTVDERQSGLLGPEVSLDDSSQPRFELGWRFKLPVFWNLGFDHDLTASPEWIQRRGIALGLEYNYAFWDDQRGRLQLWGLRERDPRVPVEENDLLTPLGLTPPDTPLTRYRADWEHNQALGQPGRLVLTYRDSSDGQVRWEYDAVTEYRPYRTYQASLSGQWDAAAVALTLEQNADFREQSVYAREASFTDLHTRPQLLPRLTTQLGGRLSDAVPLSLELGLSATRFRAEEDVSGLLYVASPTLSLPLSLGGAFELRPSVTRRFVRYTALEQYNGGAAPLEPDDESFAQTDAQLELRTALARIYSPQEGPFEAFKHRIVPRLILTQVQDVPQTAYQDSVLRSRLAERLVTLRVDNTVLGRARHPAAEGVGAAFPAQDGPVSQLLSVNLIQRYNLLLREDAPALAGPLPTLRQETLPGEPLLPLRLELLAQSGRFGASALMNYHYQLHRSTESALALSGSTATGRSLRIAYSTNEYNYVTPDNKIVAAGDSFTFGGAVKWTDSWVMGFSGRLNLRSGTPPLDRRVDGAQAYVEYHPRCYALRITYAEQVAYTVESGTLNYYLDRHLLVTFDLFGLVGGRARPPVSAALDAPPYPIVDNGTQPAQCRG